MLQRREVQKNLEKMASKEQQRQREEAAKAAKAKQLQEDRDQKVREYRDAEDQKFAAAVEAKERQRLQEQEHKSKFEEAAACRRGPKKATRPDQLRKEQKVVQMERQAAEVLANIAAATTKKSNSAEVAPSAEDKPEKVEFLAVEASSRARPKRKPIGPSRHAAEPAEVLEAEAPAPALEPRKTGMSTSSSSSRTHAKPEKRKKKAMWWQKIDGECPISLSPICELPQPPFALEPCGAAEPHYFDARFLANYLASSCDFIDPMNRRPLTREECVALDQHLRWYYPDQQFIIVADAFDLFERNVGGEVGTSVQREATSVLQHLFRFSSSRRTDARGRAVNYRDGGLTVVDDDDVIAPDASAPSRPARPTPVDEAEAFPSLPSDAPAPKAKPKSRAYPGASRCPPGREAFPTLLGSGPALKGAWQKRQTPTAVASSPVSKEMAAKKKAAEMSAKIATARANHERQRVDHWEDWA